MTQDPKVVKCRICGNLTQYTGTKRCNRCWELEKRIQADPDLAKKILDKLNKEKS